MAVTTLCTAALRGSTARCDQGGRSGPRPPTAVWRDWDLGAGWLLHLGPRGSPPPWRPPWPGLAHLPLLLEPQGRPPDPNLALESTIPHQPGGQRQQPPPRADTPPVCASLPYSAPVTGSTCAWEAARPLTQHAAGHTACRRKPPWGPWGAQGECPRPHSSRHQQPPCPPPRPSHREPAMSPESRCPGCSHSRAHNTGALRGAQEATLCTPRTWWSLGAHPLASAASRAPSQRPA